MGKIRDERRDCRNDSAKILILSGCKIPVVGQRSRNSMDDLKELGKLMKEHPIIIVVTLAAMAVGAILGAVAFYQGWLG